MNCEQVEELLSAYLDDSLAVGETAETDLELQHKIAAHLHDCVRCGTSLADFRRFDTLLAQMPRISPSPALREKIFTSPEYLELTGIDNYKHRSIGRDHTIPNKTLRRDTAGRPKLVALHGGRRVSPTSSTETPTSLQPKARRHGGSWGLSIMQTAITATLLRSLGDGRYVGWNL